MAVYLSPGVYANEIDISLIPAGLGGLLPAFIGAASKGPMNRPTYVSNGQQYIDTFGEPFPDSYLGYAVLAFLEEGTACWVLRVGVEYTPSLPSQIIADAIDISGAMNQGWGRIPVFTGIDYGEILFREVSESNPVVIHNSSVSAVITNNPEATLSVVDGSHGYTGCYDESFTILITSTGSGSGGVTGAQYTISTSTTGTYSTGIIADGGIVEDLVNDFDLTLHFSVGSGGLVSGNLFTFSAHPDNAAIAVSVEGADPITFTVPAAGTAIGYTSAAELAEAINTGLSTNSTEFAAVVTEDSGGNPVVALRTTDPGNWIQLQGGCAFCAEVGVSQYVYDIPRSYLLGTIAGPYGFQDGSNNNVVLNVIGQGITETINFVVNAGLNTSTTDLVTLLNNQGTIGGVTYFEAVELTIPGGVQLPLILTTLDNLYSQLQMQVSFVYQSCLRFAAEIGLVYPYTKAYRSFWDPRPILPKVGTDGMTPDSCDTQSLNYSISQCNLDSAYYQNIVGWLVATTPGTWANDYQVNLSVYTQGVGDPAGTFSITITDNNGVTVDSITNVSFDPSQSNYIGNVVNPGSPIGGINGDQYVQWIAPPSFLVDAASPRVPSTFLRPFSGGANGIPSDPIYSDYLDDAVIGNPADFSGLNALADSESFPVNLLLIPGFVSGAVIGNALQFCENRGNILYLVDPPYGLRAQQVVEWHNGMLTSDLTAAIDSSYGALYWSWLQIADQFNGGNIWIPPSGHVASVFARTARETEIWFAPAGTNRGILLSPTAVEFNPSQGERDLLYGNGNAVNPIVNLALEGITVFGQRTLQRESTALDRVNVRMLLIYLKVNLIQLLRQFLFEPNDQTTRTQVLAVINPFLGGVAAGRGLLAYNVICDLTNNTPPRVAASQLWVSVFVQPTTAAEFIVLNLVVMNDTQSFSAQEVLAAGGVVATTS